MDPFTIISFVKGLPWKYIAIGIGIVSIAVGVWVMAERIESLQMKADSLEKDVTRLETKLVETATAARRFEASCNATIDALDNIRKYEASKLEKLEAAKKKVLESSEQDNGPIAPVLRSVIDSLH